MMTISVYSNRKVWSTLWINNIDRNTPENVLTFFESGVFKYAVDNIWLSCDVGKEPLINSKPLTTSVVTTMHQEV